MSALFAALLEWRVQRSRLTGRWMLSAGIAIGGAGGAGGTGDAGAKGGDGGVGGLAVDPSGGAAGGSTGSVAMLLILRLRVIINTQAFTPMASRMSAIPTLSQPAPYCIGWVSSGLFGMALFL